MNPHSSRPQGVPCRTLVCLTAALLAAQAARGQIQITEIHAAPNSRAVRWDAGGQPRLGTGPAWFDPDYDASAWLSGTAPLGFNASGSSIGLGTNLYTPLFGNTASLYVRKTFTVSAQNAGSAENLRLNIDYNDGFVAFINGKEVARARLGAAKTFIYADQIAFSSRPSSPLGAQVFNLGAASGILQPGENVLAIQVANAAIDGKGDLKIDAGLELNNGIVTTTEFTENFNNANGATTKHTNTAGSISNTATGTPPAGSWLANAPFPTSDAAWTSLVIDQSLDAIGGASNTGNLRVNLTGTGPTQPARVAGPAINMATQWAAGAVSETDLDQTTVTLKYKAPQGFSANVVLEPVGGAASAALPLGPLTGTTITPSTDVVGWWRFEAASTGTPAAGATINDAPSVTNSAALLAAKTGTPVFSADLPGTRILDPITGAVYTNTYSMDATVALSRFTTPNAAILNTTSFTVEFFIKLTGEPQGFDSFARRLQDGPNTDNATASDRMVWQIDYSGAATKAGWGLIRSRWDSIGSTASGIPFDNNRVVTGARILVDTATGSGNFNDYPADTATPNPKTVGNGINDPSTNVWHHVAVTYDGAAKRPTIFTDYTAGTNLALNGAWTHPNAGMEFGKFTSTVGNPGIDPGTGATITNGPWEIKIDEVRYTARVLAPTEFLKVAAPDASGFNTFTTKLSAPAGASRTAFLAALNGASSQSFSPAIQVVDTSYSAAPGKELRIDDFSVTYARQAPITPFSGLASTWSYKAGAGEPSNGVWEPNLPKVPNNPAEAGQVAPFPDLPDFADWLELRNTGPDAVSLAGWSLTDDPDLPAKWTFPATASIPAGGHLLVLCDDNAALTGQVYLHTNFSLSAGGEKLRLYEGAVMKDEIDYPKQDAFHSYGRSGLDGTFGYFDVATPGSVNGATNSTEKCKTPDFFAADGTTAVTGGFFTGNQTLVIKTTTTGAEIRYTQDGTEPVASSTLYTGPLTLTPAANDKTGRVIRARAFKGGAVASGTKTATFLINQNAALKGVPAMVFTGDPGQTFYKGNGIMAINGGTYLPDTAGNLNVTWSAPAITDYSFGVMHGRPFERQLTLEWLRNDGVPGFNEEAGVRIASSPFSRPRLKLTGTANSPWAANPTEKPSFNLFFRADYDKGELDYPFLGPDYPVKNFDQLRPRAGKNDISNPFIKDELVRRVFNDMGHKSVKGQINTLYVDGVYKGFFNTVERYREPFFQTHFESNNPWDIRIIDVVEEGDSVEWTNLITAVNKDLSVKANYDDAMSKVVLDELIDYWLLNTYTSTWDWPNNNWVASRERVPNGRWRLHIWDAEGAFGHGSVKPPNYNTILTDLRTNSGTGTGGQSQLFRGLYASAEVKLRFADRINKWFFNGNILDDRDPVNCPIAKRKVEMTTTFAPLLNYTHGSTYSDAFWTNWTTAATVNWTYTPSGGTARTAQLPNRRSFLFGPVTYTYTPTGGTATSATDDISFRSHGLWPATEPATFSQHGGSLAATQALTISTNATVPAGSTVYFTTDGTDPREYGGVIAATAQTYSAPFVLPGPVQTTVKARVKNGTTGEWSALTEANFLLEAVPPTTSNIVVSQIMYNPTDVSTGEAAAGFTDKDDFEYIELMAIGTQTVDVQDLNFTLGISFIDWTNSPVKGLAPGQRVLLVRKLAAFRARYGNSYDSRIAGEYLGTLSNSGERLVLVRGEGAAAVTIKDFTYSDTGDWPELPDGKGGALVLNAPMTNPDHNLAISWDGSAGWGGLPNGQPYATSFSSWLGRYFTPAELADATLTAPGADADGDGLDNLTEFALGTSPTRAGSGGVGALPTGALVDLGDGSRHLEITVSLSRQALAIASPTVQVASDLNAWAAADLVSSVDVEDGTVLRVYRDPAAFSDTDKHFIRVHFTLP